MRILVIEDEPKIAAFIQHGLSEHGFAVDIATRGDEGLLVAKLAQHDLVILDVMLPRRNGWEILTALRQSGSRVPVLYLTARDAIDDRVRGFTLGADDYLVKPFAFAELLARVRALLRRGPAADDVVIVIADLRIDRLERRVTRGQHALQLTAKEYELLLFLAQHVSEVLPRELIAQHVWGTRSYGDSNAVDVAVHRVRTKLDEGHQTKLLHTVRGIGYVLGAR